jgi:hypothetical protein
MIGTGGLQSSARGARTEIAEASETVLYRYFSKTGELLYIGITDRPHKQRHGEHRAEKRWFADIDRVETASFATRTLALEAERAAIVAERPVHNIESRRVLSGKSSAEKMRALRQRTRGAGYVLRHLWVHPDDILRVKSFIERLRRRRERE